MGSSTENGTPLKTSTILARWFMDEYGTDTGVEYALIARKYKSILQELGSRNANKPITQAMLDGVISQCRKEMEKEYRTTLINIPTVGFKVADKRELALFTAKRVKHTVLSADRSYALLEITDRNLIPGALKQVFNPMAGKVKALSAGGKKFVSKFVEYIEETKKAEEQKQLLLEEKKEDA